jgi:YqaJ-like viral recombinase domain
MVEIFECEQGSPEWFECRRGIPTASEFDTVMATGRGGGESKTRRTYLYKLAGEILTGEQMYNYSNDHMERGKEMESEARDMYIFLTDLETQRVGFIRNGQKGCSPDSLIGADGMLEIKTKLAHLQCEVLACDEFPSEHKAQCQGQLWVAEREWVDFVSYWPKLPLFAKRVFRDEPYIKRLATEVDRFNNELADLIEKIRARRAA